MDGVANMFGRNTRCAVLDSLKQLRIFLKYSPKRCRRFEDCLERHNATPPQNKKDYQKEV